MLLSSSSSTRKYQNKMPKPKANSGNKPSDDKNVKSENLGFWLKRNWYLSNAIQLKSGSMMITEGTFRTNSPSNTFYPSTPPTHSNYILIFSKMNTWPPLDVQQSHDARLPNGLAINMSNWEDLKRAFARYYMMRESKCQKEINLMFGLTEASYAKDKAITDINQWSRETLQRDPGLVAHSKLRAAAIAKALKTVTPLGMLEPVDDSDDDESEEDSDIQSVIDEAASEDQADGAEASEAEGEASEEAEDEAAGSAEEEEERKTEYGSDFDEEGADNKKRKKEAISDGEADVVVVSQSPASKPGGAKMITTAVAEKKTVKTPIKKAKSSDEAVEPKTYAAAAKGAPVSMKQSL